MTGNHRRTNMVVNRREFVRLGVGVPLLLAGNSLAFASREFWDAKPPSEWSSDEVDRLLTKSPWARDVSIADRGGPGGLGGSPGGGGGRSRGGLGLPGGIGFPGGGGLGYPRGGSPYPGGGTPYPGGGPSGGSPTGGTGYPGDGRGGRQDRGGRGFRGTVRWESALPVQDALRIGGPDEKRNPDFEKYYVLVLLGDLPMVGGSRRGNGDDDEDTAQSERRQEMFKQYTRLERGSGPVELVRVEEGSRIGSKGPGVHFYFSRLDNISLDDKQATFSTKLGPLEIRTKFVLKDMLYHGKLAL